MAKASNGNGTKPALDLVEQALVDASVTMRAVPHANEIIAELRWLLHSRPNAEPSDMVTVIAETAKLAADQHQVWVRENFIMPLKLAGRSIRNRDEVNPPPTPRREVDKHMNALLDAKWGTRLADDLGMLRSDFCTLRDHAICLHIRPGERIVQVTPSWVVVSNEAGAAREIGHLEIVEAHRDKDFRIYKYREQILDPLAKVITAAEQNLADRKYAESHPHGGIEYDTKE